LSAPTVIAQHSLALQAAFQRSFGIDSVFEAWRALSFQAPRRAVPGNLAVAVPL
jgi:hypothetical protein